MIKVNHLIKKFDAIEAVNDISFNVEKGDVLGFLGPNGAGKSTTMKMLVSYLQPSSGEIFIDEISVLDSPIYAKKIIGYMPENAPLYDDMTVSNFLNYIAEMRGIPLDKRQEEIERVLKICTLEEVSLQMIGTLSKGFRRRVSLGQALIHDPKVLILDEPTDGLDPNQKHEVRKLIKSLSKDKAIILSTHILEEVDALCNRVVIISEGIIKFNGVLNDLKSKSNKSKLDDVFRAITLNEKVEGVTL